jgi:hypothetical protein
VNYVDQKKYIKLRNNSIKEMTKRFAEMDELNFNLISNIVIKFNINILTYYHYYKKKS